MRKDRIEMSLKEVKRIGIVQRVVEGKLSQRSAGKILGLVERQIRRIVKRYREEGEKGLIHRLRGQNSNRKHAEEVKATALKLYEKKYKDFGPSLAWEKIAEKHGLRVGCQTLRRWLIEAQLWRIRNKKHDQQYEWRQRKSCCGEMVQIDGSHHDWLEGRGPRLVLQAYIDDATSHVYGRFYDYEGTIPILDSFNRYVRRYGLPRSVYMDRHGAYCGSKRRDPYVQIREDLLGDSRPQTQFERAMRELGVDVIHANSPQAKGRVERLFATLQDRLVKELRLAKIKTKEQANQFLNRYLVDHNRRFMVAAQEPGDVHRWESKSRLKSILSIQSRHVLRHDNTARHGNEFYQILEDWRGYRPKEIVFEKRLDGKLYLTHKGRELKWRLISGIPKKVIKKKAISKPPVPPPNHPFKRASYESYLRKQQYQNSLNQTRTFLLVSN